MVVVLVEGVVVLLLLLFRSSALAAGWWYFVSVCGMVVSVDAFGCSVVDGVCNVDCGVVVMCVGRSVYAEIGGGVLGVDIWAGVGVGGGGVVYGGCSVWNGFGVVVGGFGGGVVVFGLHSLLPSGFPVQFGQTIFQV
jgi:hypothetical protein